MKLTPWTLAVAGVALFAGVAVASAVGGIIWPVHEPAAAVRAWNAVWLLGVLFALAGLVWLLVQKRHRGGDQ